MYILGISALYHDSAAALINDDEILAAAQEERFTRIKADRRIPVNAIGYCLREAGIAPAQLDAVIYYDDPVLTLDRTVCNARAVSAEDPAAVQGADAPIQSPGSAFGEKMWIEKILRDLLGRIGKDDRLHVCRHHISHAASAFYPSPFEEAAILTVDGVGEWDTTAIGVGEGSDIRLLRTIGYPHSLGLLYSAFTYFCGFRVNYGDYKLMGLAPYGEPVYADLIRSKLIDIKDDGSFRLDLDYFDYQYGRAMTNDAFAALFGGPRRAPEDTITKREMDIAASAQAVTEEIMIKLARTARGLTGKRQLVMAGGVALNCVANGLIAREGIFDDIWVQPAAGDAGGALGAALAYRYMELGMPRPKPGKSSQETGCPVAKADSQKGSLLGPSFSTEEICGFLDGIGAPYHICPAGPSERTPEKESLPRTAARLLADQKVIGLFHGRMEYGPRALGARSIIADPRSDKMQSHLNLSIKYRESFRPFAPAALAEKAGEYFDISCFSDDRLSPYMLFTCPVTKGVSEAAGSFKEELASDPDLIKVLTRRRSDIPAVTHVDLSARLQTVNKETDPYFYDIISAFDDLTGCPVVINTSFNVRGEPIVCDPKDAYHCFMNTEMDVLIMENVILYKEEQPDEERRHDRYEPD